MLREIEVQPKLAMFCKAGLSGYDIIPLSMESLKKLMRLSDWMITSMLQLSFFDERVPEENLVED